MHSYNPKAKPMHTANREDYLTTLVDEMRPWFAHRDLTLPAVIRVSVGFPSLRATAKHQAIGQCFAPSVSTDGSVQIFISPVLGNGLRVADVLVHELCHAAVGTQHGHGWLFRKAAYAIGLEGKPTATIASKGLTERLNALLEKIGPYPHAELQIDLQPAQSTRLLKAYCHICRYTVRVTRRWLHLGGPPICPICKVTMQATKNEPERLAEEKRADEAAATARQHFYAVPTMTDSARTERVQQHEGESHVEAQNDAASK
jgi:hypothetical protein